MECVFELLRKKYCGIGSDMCTSNIISVHDIKKWGKSCVSILDVWK